MILVLRKKSLVLIICSFVFVISVMRASAVFGREIMLPVIMYHHITENPARWGDYVISPEEFENDIKYLHEKEYNAVSAKMLINYTKNGKKLPKNPIMITFDDGFESFYKYAMPVLEKYGFCAVMAVVGEYTDKFSEADDHNINYSYLTWDEIEQIAECGYVEIANHTYDLHKINESRRGANIVCGEEYENYKEIMTEEVLSFQQKIEKHTGRKIRIFAYPFGFYSSASTKALKEFKFDITFTCDEKINIIRDKASLLNLGRFNRPHGIPAWKFFDKIIDF